MKNQLAVDLGTYSVKFYETVPEGKNLKLIGYEEIPLDRFDGEVYQDMTVQEIQLAIMAKYIRKINFKDKILCHLPNEMMTTRYLELPVANRKKAEMMIPFQLEENIPYSASEVHLGSLLHKKGKENFAQINVTEKAYFRELYKYLEEREILPAVITTEPYSLQSYLVENNIKESLCFIDIGHETTKVYFVEDGLIVANHTSYVAGHSIDETIAKTYDIPLDEAVIYKHDNCFFLTEDQYENVNQDQKDFAALMKKSFWPLILELRRWEVGFRVKYGKPVNKVLITGGTSNINNIENFLAESLSLPVKHFKPFQNLRYDIVGVDQEMKNSMSIAHLLTSGQNAKLRSPNLLHGEFPSHYSDSIPLHSSAFIGLRVAIIALIMMLGLGIERMFVQQDITTLDRVIVNQLQSSDLDIPRRIRDLYRTRPERILNEVSQKNNRVQTEYQALSQIAEVDAMDALIAINDEIPSNENVNLKKVFTDGRLVEANFVSDKINELERLQQHLMDLGKPNAYIDLNTNEKNIIFSYQRN